MKIARVNIEDGVIKFGQELVKSFEETGFAIITGYDSINKYSLSGFYETCRHLFSDLHRDPKLVEELSKGNDKQKGFFSFGKEKAKDQEVFDLKEFYHFYKGDEDPSGFMFSQMHQSLYFLGMHTLAGLEMALLIDLMKCVSMEQTLFRILHYPALEENSSTNKAVRAAAHEDINLITLLPAASEMGLQVKDLQGNWHNVECNPGEIVVNVGDMLQELTGGQLKSTTHRVVNGDLSEPRFSCPLFFHPKPETVLSDRYTAGQYLEERLKELGLKE